MRVSERTDVAMCHTFNSHRSNVTSATCFACRNAQKALSRCSLLTVPVASTAGARSIDTGTGRYTVVTEACAPNQMRGSPLLRAPACPRPPSTT